jgi:shikimate dehydrogenase
MNITGTTRVFMVLGDPIAQVRAPEVFNHLFHYHGADAVLVPMQVAPAHLDGFVRHAFTAMNVHGIWLAIPHKPAMLKLLDRCEDMGRVAGAVNAARRHADGSLEGALFDGVGFVKALGHFGISLRDKRALLVGVGGGGVAIAVALAHRGVNELALFDVSPSRAAEAAASITSAYGTPVQLRTSADPAGFDLVINATPLGLKAGDPLPFDVNRLDRGAVVVDILMTRSPTPLLQACAARGITAHPGYEMLVQQVPEYLSFFGFANIARAVQADAGPVRALLQPR